MKISTGKFFISFKSIDHPLLQELELGLDEHTHFEYFHHWQGHQYHCISLGNTYLYWKGFPFIDIK